CRTRRLALDKNARCWCRPVRHLGLSSGQPNGSGLCHRRLLHQQCQNPPTGVGCCPLPLLLRLEA
ncbi:hypothetical protein D046_4577, partial [Vibrio parahaemolyticus V-223/04]